MHRHADSRLRRAAALSLGLYAASLPAAQVGDLQTAEAAYREVAVTYGVDAVVEAVRQSTVSSQIAGRIVEIAYDVGDHVSKGQVIVRIDERQAAEALAGTQAQVAQAAAVLENARAQLQRTRSLATQRFVSQAALDRAQADYDAAAAAYKAAVAGAGQAATAKGYATVVAPYSGVVAARHVELGEMATPGKPLMTGFDPDQMRAVATVPEYKVAQVRAAEGASVELPALDRSLPAASITVLPIADARTHSAQVRVALPPGQPDLFPGMFARAHFVVGKATRLVVPARAVFQRSELTAVYVVHPDGVRLRQVRTGTRLGRDEVEILAGVAPGERVALDPIQAGMLASAAATAAGGAPR